MKRCFVLIGTVWLGTLCVAAQTMTFNHVKIHRHRSEQKRALVDKVGVLVFDDTAREIRFRSQVDDKWEFQDKLDVGYNSITKIVFEVTTHMRGGGLAQVLQAATVVGAMAGTAIAGQHVQDYWFYIDYKDGPSDRQALLEVPRDSSDSVINKAASLFGAKVAVSEFQEKGEEINPDQLADHKSKQALKIDKADRPVPEVKPDKATIVVVCPPLAARDSGKGNQFKLHANDRVIAVNREGTYSIAYLDPGKYRLVSQSENANGFEMELEAGTTYYFLQNTFQGVFKGHTALSRNSPELVMYLADGTYFSDWHDK